MKEQVAVAGSGAIACGLAAALAEHSDVLLLARSDGSAARAASRTEAIASKLDATGTIRVSTDPSDLDEATYIVEAIVEDFHIKAAHLTELAAHAGPSTIFATTTSALPVQQLAEASGHPERFAALHVFNPVHKMKLVELCFPPQASEDTRRRTLEMCVAIGKVAVEVPDTPGFVVNRLLFPYLFDAVRLMEQTGLSAEAIDSCMQLGAGHPMGPLALLDFVGLDVAEAIGDAIGVEVPQRIRDLVAEGALGRKAGRGLHV